MPLEVDANGVLQPLGLKVIRDNRHEIVPGIRKYTEEIPGVDGEIYFGANLRRRVLELVVGRKVSLDAASSDYRATVMRDIAAQLNPLSGEQELTFADDPGKLYKVRLADAVDISREREYLEFSILFEMAIPYILGTPQKSLTGSGAATNDGNVAAPFVVTIDGPVTDPTVIVAGVAMSYVGTVGEGKSLIIDTEKMTALLDGANALPNYNGEFPKLAPGESIVTAAAGGTTTITWYDRWI